MEYSNNVRLNNAIGSIKPTDMLAGRQAENHAQRDRKLEEARKPVQSDRLGFPSTCVCSPSIRAAHFDADLLGRLR